jgi:hypothetical protein
MKRFLPGLGALVILWGLCTHSLAADKTPVISIVLEHKSMEAVSHLPAIDGSRGVVPGFSSFTDGSVSYLYKVASATPGHYSVEAHYNFTLNGVKTTVDKTLHVYEKKPEQGQWIQLHEGWNACAFLTDKLD